MLDALKIPSGATVADIGAGAGYHSIRLARLVGPKGMVYATDVQPEMLRMLRENARTAGSPTSSRFAAPRPRPDSPTAAIDLILMVNVYHECSDPEAILQGLHAALKPRGRLVLVEFRGEDPEVPIKPEHKMTLAQVRLEVEPQGFTFKESLEFLPWQHVIIFEKPGPAGTKTRPDAKDGPPKTGSSPTGPRSEKLSGHPPRTRDDAPAELRMGLARCEADPDPIPAARGEDEQAEDAEARQ